MGDSDQMENIVNSMNGETNARLGLNNLDGILEESPEKMVFNTSKLNLGIGGKK